MLLKKFRKSFKVEKKYYTEETMVIESYNPCGQRTPNHGAFASTMSSHSGGRSSWTSSSASDSGYGSFSGSDSRTLGSQFEDIHTVASLPPPPSRWTTYSSSVYSGDADRFDSLEPMPTTVEDEEEDMFDMPPVSAAEYHEDPFDLPPRTLSCYSNNFTAKSRFARLNQLPAATPRALVLSDNVLHESAGTETQEPKGDFKGKRGKWNPKGSLSVARLPSQLRRLSFGKTSKE